jgi:K+-transporting ATPase ATPase A chain
MFNNLTQFSIVLVVMTALVIVMGKWLARTFTNAHHGAPERWTYRLLGVNPAEAMSWKRHGMALLLGNTAMMLLG